MKDERRLKETIGIDRGSRKRRAFTYSFGILIIIAGLALNMLGIKGNEALTGFGSVGNWLIMIGVISIFIATLKAFDILGKRKPVDERVEFIAARASRLAFMAFLVVAFAIMVADAVHPLAAPYFTVMSGLICGMVLAYAMAFKVLERRY